MRMPWDRRYFKICFYAVVTFGMCYALKLVLDTIMCLFTGFGDVLLGVAAFFNGIFSLFLPLLVGLGIAFVLEPFVARLEKAYASVAQKWQLKRGEARTAGTVLTFGVIASCFFLLTFLAAKWLGDMSGNSGTGFLQIITYKTNRAADDIRQLYHGLHLWLMAIGAPLSVSDTLALSVDSLSAWFASAGETLVSSAAVLGQYAAAFIMGVIIAFYFLRDKHRVLRETARLSQLFLPKKIYPLLATAAGDIRCVFSGYLRGQLTDAVIMAALIGLWLSFLQVPFAVLIALISGFSNVIPYFGALIGFTLSILSALLSGDPLKALYAGIGIFILQQLDGLYIVPKVIGKRVELGPVTVLVALFAAGQLFGIIGMVFAVPFCAVVKIFFTRFTERRNP